MQIPSKLMTIALAVAIVGATAAASMPEWRSPLVRPVFPLPVADSTKLEVWYVFRAIDCGLSPATIKDLNALASASRVVVRGVLVDAPDDSTSTKRLLEALDVKFPVSSEADAWRRAVRANGLSLPALVLREKGQVLGIGSLDFIHRLRQYAPATLRIGHPL